MARAGARVILDEVFLGGAASQQRWQQALGELQVLWVGVRCEAAAATSREIARGDRVPGMAASQAGVVHRGVSLRPAGRHDARASHGMRPGNRRPRDVSGGGKLTKARGRGRPPGQPPR